MKGHHLAVLIYFIRRDFSLGDFAKDTVRHFLLPSRSLVVNSSTQLFFNQLWHRGQGFVQLGLILSARHSEIGPSAAVAAG